MKVSSFNCGGFKSNFEFIKILMKDCDIICVQESLLYDSCNKLLGSLSDCFDFEYQSAYRNFDHVGRASGGLVIYWRKNIASSVKVIYKSKRLICLTFKFLFTQFTIINCYMPCDYNNNISLIEYRETLSELHTLILSHCFEKLIILGDFNADPSKGRFFNELMTFNGDNNLQMFDKMFLPNDSYTYVSSNDSCGTSWLDHVLVNDVESINNINIRYGFKFDDHLPMEFDLNDVCVPGIVNEHVNVDSDNYCHVLWGKLSDSDIDLYRENLNYYFDNYVCDSFSCFKSQCNCNEHKLLLSHAYMYLNACIFAASCHFKVAKQNNGFFKQIAGWNDNCRKVYGEARVKYRAWDNAGRDRSCLEFDEMKESRKSFKNALRFCKLNEDCIKKDKLLASYKVKNKNVFWRDVKNLNKNNKPVITAIDEGNNVHEIINIFTNKYKAILDDPDSQTVPDNYNELIEVLNTKELLNSCRIFCHDIDFAIDSLSHGLGLHFIHSNYFKYAPSSMRRFLSRLFSSFLVHNFVPDEMMEGEIHPTIKDESGNKKDSSNYWPVMISNNVLKLFEYSILPNLKRYLKISDRQFGFRSNSSCPMAVATLKETVFNYTLSNSNVHCAVLDMTKAFDKLNFNVLFCKMVESGLPAPLVNIVNYMNFNTNVYVKYGDVKGDRRRVGNGARQGGCLSGLIFNFYIDDII